MRTKKKKCFRVKFLSVLLVAGLLAGMANASILAAEGSQEEIFQEKNLLNSENVQVEVLADIPETAPAEIPEEVRVFLDAVQSLKALGGLTEENAEEFNARGQAAMDAYEVVQNANLEDYEGVEEALAALIEAGNSMTGGVEEAAAGKMCNGSSTLYVGQITVDKNNKQKSYVWPKKTTLPCDNWNSHSYNATHGFPYSAIKACGPAGSIGYTRQSPGAPGTEISVAAWPFGTLQTSMDKTICLVYRVAEYTLTIKYTDENGKEIKTSNFKTYEAGSQYTETAPDIPGYTLTGAGQITGKMPEKNHTTIFDC